MVLSQGIDIGSCVNSSMGVLTRIDCTVDDHNNYCCSNPLGLLVNSSSRVCCSYEDYANQHWAMVAAIRCSLVLLIAIFLVTMMTLFLFFVTSWGISEEDIQASRRIILKELLKKQILYRTRRTIGPYAVSGLRNLSSTLSNSAPKRAKKSGTKQTGTDQRQTAENPVKVTNDNARK
jgi:hypothetical protein